MFWETIWSVLLLKKERVTQTTCFFFTLKKTTFCKKKNNDNKRNSMSFMDKTMLNINEALFFCINEKKTPLLFWETRKRQDMWLLLFRGENDIQIREWAGRILMKRNEKSFLLDRRHVDHIEITTTSHIQWRLAYRPYVV